ncbi:FtsQ-type POTRA domain-containing protein [Streptomyces netropsis]|uniref:cell division protein FtsQ/DivIB n=1 Tax=Streptomyces netropsis TaxID=55404 RepID=UPI0030CCA6CF
MAGPTTARRGGGKNGKPPRSRPSPSPPRSGGRPGKAKPRRPRLRPRRRKLLGWAAVTVALGAAVGWALYGSSWLRVTHVEVSGTAVLTSGEVRREAAVPFGDPLASVDTDAIADRLRDRLPRIEAVDVERSWPRGISLKVTERQPKVVLEKGGKFIEIDGTGVRFATVDQAPKGVPRLRMAAEDSPGTHRFGPERLEREAVRVAVDLPPAVRRDTLAIRVRSYDSITLELTGGRTVVWGSGERGDVKARTLTALLKAARGADHFDVSAPGAPAASGS